MTRGKPLHEASRSKPGRLTSAVEGSLRDGPEILAYQVCQLIKHFIDLLAVHKPNMGLSH